jgi:hypothetical protein
MHLFTSAYFSLQTSFFKLALLVTLENLRSTLVVRVRYWKVSQMTGTSVAPLSRSFLIFKFMQSLLMQKINGSCKMSFDRIFMIKWRNILLADDLIIGRLSSGTLMQKIN